jgi:GAF domain-containing protein
MQAIYDLVGDKIGEITGSEIVVINTWNKQTETTRYEYIREKGERVGVIERPFTPLNKMLLPELENGKTIIWNEGMEERLKQFGHSLPAGELPLSVLIVPLKTGNEIKISISLQDTRREHAFSDSIIRLIKTLASSMSVALENARLFNETEQRAAELAIINSVQQGLASKLDFQGIIDLVGDKIREIFDAQSINITHYDAQLDLFSSLYTLERGVRLSYEPMTPGPIYHRIIKSRESLLFHSLDEYTAIGAVTVPGTESSKSGIYVPLLQGKEFMGVIALENVDRENAFLESDLRLLTTLTNSMSVALENARLFDETQRLLKETEERNAELAVINSVQQGLASKLEFQAIIDLIGDKIVKIFDAQATLISLFNPATKEIDHRYLMERGERITLDKPVPIDKFRQRVVETRQPWTINHDYRRITIEIGEEPVLQGEEPKSLLFVPMIVGKEVTGIISLQNLDIEDAFNDSDVRLLTTIAASMSVALENARLFEETQRLLKETEQRAGELAAISTVSQALVAETELDNMIQLIGSQMLEIFEADIVYVALLDSQTDLIHFPYQMASRSTRSSWAMGSRAKSSRPASLYSSIRISRNAAHSWVQSSWEKSLFHTWVCRSIRVRRRLGC